MGIIILVVLNKDIVVHLWMQHNNYELDLWILNVDSLDAE